jgi:hypothetical protein
MQTSEHAKFQESHQCNAQVFGEPGSVNDMLLQRFNFRAEPRVTDPVVRQQLASARCGTNKSAVGESEQNWS